jgi:hypothetical protein
MMFKFLVEWDPILADYKCDIERVIKGEVKLWSVAMQTYCERLMKLFNNKVKVYTDDSQLSFGKIVGDSHFRDIFQRETGFHDFNSLKKLNRSGNDRKHSGILTELEKNDIKEWLKRLHTLSLKTYNYLYDKDYREDFDESEVEKILMTTEEEFSSVIDYADDVISRKNIIIANLESDCKELESFISDDTKELLSYSKLIRKLEKERDASKSLISNYDTLLAMFGDYVELNRRKSHSVNEIVQFLCLPEFGFESMVEPISQEIQEIQELKAKNDVLLQDIEAFIQNNMKRSKEKSVEKNNQNSKSRYSFIRDIYGYIPDSFDLSEEDRFHSSNTDQEDGYVNDFEDDYGNDYEEESDFDTELAYSED